MDAEKHLLKEIFCIGRIAGLVVEIGSEQRGVALHEYLKRAIFTGQNLFNKGRVFHERILGPGDAGTSGVYAAHAKVGAASAPIRRLDSPA